MYLRISLDVSVNAIAHRIKFPSFGPNAFVLFVCVIICSRVSHIYYILIGYSDPYCMLGIKPDTNVPPVSPLPPLASRTLSDVGFDNNLESPHQADKLRKYHSFRLSFKRRDGRQQRDSISSDVPAKFIRATSIKNQTLSPTWNEKFKLYVHKYIHI